MAAKGRYIRRPILCCARDASRGGAARELRGSLKQQSMDETPPSPAGPLSQHPVAVRKRVCPFSALVLTRIADGGVDRRGGYLASNLYNLAGSGPPMPGAISLLAPTVDISDPTPAFSFSSRWTIPGFFSARVSRSTPPLRTGTPKRLKTPQVTAGGAACTRDVSSTSNHEPSDVDFSPSHQASTRHRSGMAVPRRRVVGC